jgi:hypothetical protein
MEQNNGRWRTKSRRIVEFRKLILPFTFHRNNKARHNRAFKIESE